MITSIVGPKLARPVLYGLIASVLIALIFMVARCDRDTSQVEQTTASSEAIANAAGVAIETLENRIATETEIDRAVAAGVMEIENATDVDAVRNAVLASVCGSASHSDDPACQVR